MRSRSRCRIITRIEVPTGRITAITPSPHAVGRFDLAIEGDPIARLPIESVERLHLNVGVEVDEARATAIGAEADVVRAYDRAIVMLAGRGRATGELRRLLVRKGELPVVVEQVINRLRAAAFLDDEAFARQFARYRAATAGFSRRRIEQDLVCRGIDHAMAAAAIEETFREECLDEAAALERAAEKKLRIMSRVDGPAKRRRLYAFLARRGYDMDAIRQAMRRATRSDAMEG